MDIINATPNAPSSRLERPGRVFTSHFSAPEFALLQSAGYEALGQVLGVSVFQTGIQWTGGGWKNSERGRAVEHGISFEITTETSAFYEARSLALSRMRDEAIQLGASLVLGAKIVRRVLPADPNEHPKEWEFKALGTAVRRQGPRPDPNSVLSNLSPAEFLQLTRAGYSPLGIVAGNCNWLHVPNQQSGLLLSAGPLTRRWRTNQELPDVTKAVYQARELAMSRLQAEAMALKADGVLGLEVETDPLEPSRVALNQTANRLPWSPPMGWHFFALGTAVKRRHIDSNFQVGFAVSLST